MNPRILGIFLFATAFFSSSAFASSHREAPAFNAREVAPTPIVAPLAGELIPTAPLPSPIQIGVVNVVRPNFTPSSASTSPVAAPASK